MTISVQFIQGLEEEITGVSLRQRKDSPNKIVVLVFDRIQAIEKLRSFTNGVDNLWLVDEEGQIQVFPSGIKFFYRNDDDLVKAECSIELRSEEEFERVMRFLHHYAEAHGFQFESR
ncbi:MAG: photosystem II reaction center protein Psb28 [Gloeobacterales cyanobacterium]